MDSTTASNALVSVVKFYAAALAEQEQIGQLNQGNLAYTAELLKAGVAVSTAVSEELYEAAHCVFAEVSSMGVNHGIELQRLRIALDRYQASRVVKPKP